MISKHTWEQGAQQGGRHGDRPVTTLSVKPLPPRVQPQSTRCVVLKLRENSRDLREIKQGVKLKEWKEDVRPQDVEHGVQALQPPSTSVLVIGAGIKLIPPIPGPAGKPFSCTRSPGLSVLPPPPASGPPRFSQGGKRLGGEAEDWVRGHKGSSMEVIVVVVGGVTAGGDDVGGGFSTTVDSPPVTRLVFGL